MLSLREGEQAVIDKNLLEEWLRALPDGDDIYLSFGLLVSRRTGVTFELADVPYPGGKMAAA